MRNISELIGIIKGINFDGVINDKEVERLQSWADRNRNIAYEQRQVDLIKLVDEVLEDKVIDEDEKDSLIKCAESILKEEGDTSDVIYELHGIVEGIICDGEVNEAEVHNLKEWINSNSNLIRDNNLSEELCSTIDSILEDGVVTEDAQEQLLALLSNKIRNTQFETKLDYLCRLVRERKNIGVELIDTLNNASAMSEIHKRAEEQLLSALKSTNGFCLYPEIVVVSLVLIAMLEYNDGVYYEKVRSTYTQAYSRYSVQRVEGAIRTILSRYKKQDDSGSRTRIINVALENAIVPKHYLAAFFEFIFDIYKLNFDYDLPEDLYEDFKFVFEGLRSNMLSEGDEISINVTQKTYKLIVSTKHLILDEAGLDSVIKLSTLIVKLIDKRFWDKEIKIFNPYLKTGFEGWEKQLKDSTNGKQINKRSNSDLRSRWEPKFVLENNAVYLVPPIHKIKSQYDYRKIAIVVLNDDEELFFDNCCDIREIIGGYQINPTKIKIEKPLGKLRYCLRCDDEIIYDSKTKLYRNHIVFNSDGQELNNNTDFDGTVFICYRAGEAELQNILTGEYYCIGYKHIIPGDALQIGKDVFNFSSLTKPGVVGKVHENCVLKVDEERCLQVYKDVTLIAFEAENKSNKFEILINGKPYKLSDMKYNFTERENITKYVVEFNDKTNGLFSVEVNQLFSGKKNKILKDEFVVDSELSFHKERVDDTHYILHLSSGLADSVKHIEISVEDDFPGMVRFDFDKRHCEYILPLDLGFYKIDENAWNTATTDLWIDDISFESKMTLFDSKCDGLLIYAENGTLLEDNVAITDNGAFRELNIGFLKTYKAGNRYVKLVFTSDEKIVYTMFCYYKCVMDKAKTEILFVDNPKRARITPVFHGKNEVFFEMLGKDGKRICKSKNLKSWQTSTLYGFHSFREYTFNFHEVTKVLLYKKDTLLHSIKKTFYAREDYVGRTLKMVIAYYDQIKGDEWYEKEQVLKNTYVEIIGVTDDGLLLGNVFVYTTIGKCLLDRINPVEIELCSEVIDDTLDVYMTNCGDGLLIDVERRGIMNNLVHPSAPDVFLFTLKMKEA